MTAPTSARRPLASWEVPPDPREWLRVGFAVLLVLIAVSIFLAVAIPLLQGSAPSWMVGPGPWNWVIGLVGALIAISIVVLVFRIIFIGLWGPAYFRPYWRGYYRHYRLGGGWGHDPAVETARERYARGEITADQLDEILRELAKVSSPLPPA